MDRALRSSNRAPKTILSYDVAATQLIPFVTEQGLPTAADRISTDHIRAFLEEMVATLAELDRHLQVEVDVGNLQIGHLPEPNPPIEEQANDGLVPPLVERLARSGLDQSAELPPDRTGTVGSCSAGALIRSMGFTGISLSSNSH